MARRRASCLMRPRNTERTRIRPISRGLVLSVAVSLPSRIDASA
jgi:hypothetical protein